MVDHKLDVLASELIRRYKVSVGTVQEIKWFGSDIWQADGYTLLHLTSHSLVTVRTLYEKKVLESCWMDEKATNAWRAAGEAWEAVRSRLVTTTLKITRVGQRIPGG